MKLTNKVALITGGTSGIGFEAAKLFAAEGASVVVTGTNAERIAETAQALGDSALVLRADVRIASDLDTVMSAIASKHKAIDIVFANAGIGLVRPFDEITEDQIDDIFAINFKGLFFTIQKAAPLIKKGGSIVVTTSFLNEVGVPGFSMLSATKAAVRSLVRSLGAELVGRGIRVNAVSPGPISTPFHSKLGFTDAQLNEVAAGIEAQVPMKRFGEGHEIARAALFLASEESSYMTGTEIVVDGGMTQF